jgi:hypothetical protein
LPDDAASGGEKSRATARECDAAASDFQSVIRRAELVHTDNFDFPDVPWRFHSAVTVVTREIAHDRRRRLSVLAGILATPRPSRYRARDENAYDSRITRNESDDLIRRIACLLR